MVNVTLSALYVLISILYLLYIIVDRRIIILIDRIYEIETQGGDTFKYEESYKTVTKVSDVLMIVIFTVAVIILYMLWGA